MISMPTIMMTTPIFLKNKWWLSATVTLFMMLPEVAQANIAPGSESSAVYYAKQAGAVGGAAAACGQPITVFNNRSGEVIDVLAKDAQDKAAAKAAFDATVKMKQQEQSSSPSLSSVCPGILNDFNNNLPLMKDDYQTTVLAELKKTNPPPPPAPPVAAQPMLPGSPPYPGQFPEAQARSSVNNPIFPALATPVMTQNPAFTPQNYVGPNPQANIAPVNLNAYPNATANANVAVNNNASDAEKLKVISQLTQVLQSLSNNNANTQTPPPAGQQPMG